MPSWRDTLFIWQGPLDIDKDKKKVHWKGKWIGCEECPDPKDVEMPSESDFSESELTFEVMGDITLAKKKKGDALLFHRIRFKDGKWDLQEEEGEGEKKVVNKYGDDKHLVHLASIDKAAVLIKRDVYVKQVATATGVNAFGHFVSAGTVTVAAPASSDESDTTEEKLILTLARRYIEDEDVRVKMSARDIYVKISEESSSSSNDDESESMNDFWKHDELHSETRLPKSNNKPKRKRKRT